MLKKLGLSPIWITCNIDNIPARKNIERIGAVYIETLEIPEGYEFSDFYPPESRKKCASDEISNHRLSGCILRVNEHSNVRGAWQQVAPKVYLRVVNTGEVTARLIEARDKAILNRV